MQRCRQTRPGQGAREELRDLPQERMKRYENPIPLPCCCPPAGWTELDGVLEYLARQNQLLLDLLGAVNGLTAAVLSIQARLPSEK